MVDPYGPILALIRDASAVTAIVGQRVGNEVEAPPSVQLIANATTRRPFGVSSGRLEMQLWIGIARCFGVDSTAGAILARQLAGAVSDALHGRSPTMVGTKFIARAYAPDLDGVNRDPDLHWPYVDVRLEVHAAAQAVA